jgi:tetratricopeptide (TPR) repeat protein
MSFLGEIKRRKVFQVAAVYAVVAWLLVQIVATIEAPLNLPDWFDTFVIVLVGIGFPITLIISWAFNLRPDGLVRDLGGDSRRVAQGRGIEYSLIGLLALAVAFLFFEDFVRDGGPSSAPPPTSNASNSASRQAAPRSIANAGAESPEPPVADGRQRALENSVAVLPFLNVSPNPNDAYFAIETDIAMNVANALEAEFSPAEQQAIERAPTTSAAAYALYLQARSALSASIGRETAHALLDRAIEIDPAFASAYGLKARMYSATFVNTAQGTGVATVGRESLERQVRDYAARAFALDPGNAEARAALRGINVPTWRWSQFEQAVEPGDKAALSGAQNWIFAWMGRVDEAIANAERNVERNPNNAGAYLLLGVSYAYAKNCDAAVRSLQRGQELAPALALIQAWKAYIEAAQGHVDNAAAELALTEQLLGADRPVVYLPELAYSYSRIGRRADVARLMAEIEALDDPDDFGAGAWAVAYLATGDEARALEQLEVVAEEAGNHVPDQGYLNVMNLKMNYLDDPTLEKPEFVDVLARISGD